MKKTILRLLLSLFFCTPTALSVEPTVLPAPKQMQTAKGGTALPLSVSAPEIFSAQAQALEGALRQLFPQSGANSANSSTIEIQQAEGLGAEGYRIDIQDSVRIFATETEGVARAAATLLQLGEAGAEGAWFLPRGSLADSPDYAFRAFLVDMGRNPHSPATLREIIDAMWLAKTRYLHLHLTDDQLFSFPSTAFPKLLSEQAGWTLQDWHEMEAYSQARGVTIIPELEAPGHSGILRNEYPEVFGKTPTELASLDSAYEGLTTILEEMMAVFQATPYIHIGCDEAFGVDEHLQRALVNRLHAFLKKHGRETIVWEGPRLGEGENKVNEEVIHMNWRSIEMPAPQMVEAGYRLINANWDPLYVVDHYPRTMFTAVPTQDCYELDLTRFKHINHAFETFHKPLTIRKSEQLLGFCMAWWEGREENVLPLCRQRLTAATARAWNDQGEDSFESFLQRDQKLAGLLARLHPGEKATPTGGWPDRREPSLPGNLAYGKEVTVSAGASQPHFGPQRLTNGATDRFDHFLGFPTKPEALEITIDLEEVTTIDRIEVYEAAVHGSWESYQVQVSRDGRSYRTIGETRKGSRGDSNKVVHPGDQVRARYVRLRTAGCEDLTFPSFSRLCEIMVFGE
ncbi:family 20 glycosylhydrolase [Roseibacillus ishigakijimensis]|uniref:beta-N-acetylhexosaminidase n=1 Tax=Roseibacillus ishigakijimensis TaxID=454146 RepID=A0A934VMA3_9BACT|nr:family 20 glycosylhydrolase [Roseibacillus ishigakijimensis]MBK1833735.1 family 20 glycosylhydrolase [Roseibacillus ishigakijimensis]